MTLLFLRSVFVKGKHVDAGQVADVSQEDASILTSGNRPACVKFNPDNPEHKAALDKLKVATKKTIKSE